MSAPNIGSQAFACAIAMTVVETFVVALRYASRIITKTRAGIDDWLILPAFATALTCNAVIMYMTQNTGLGFHIATLLAIAPEDVASSSKLSLVFQTFYALTCQLTRMIIVSLYLRIFTDKISRIACYVLIACMVVLFAIAVPILATQCVPIAALWDPSIKDAHCINVQAWYTYSTIPNVVFDGCILLLPIPTLVKLRLPLGDKIGLFATFTAGGLGTVAAIARIIVFDTINGTVDSTWTSVPLAVVSLVEMGCYLITACLPGLRPLYLYMRGKAQYTKRNTPGYNYDSNEPHQRKVSSYRLNSVDNYRSVFLEQTWEESPYPPEPRNYGPITVVTGGVNNTGYSSSGGRLTKERV